MKNKFIPLVNLLVIGALGLAACGSKQEGNVSRDEFGISNFQSITSNGVSLALNKGKLVGYPEATGASFFPSDDGQQGLITVPEWIIRSDGYGWGFNSVSECWEEVKNLKSNPGEQIGNQSLEYETATVDETCISVPVKKPADLPHEFQPMPAEFRK